MTQLRVPGPTPLAPAVIQAMTQPMINHRGPEFRALIQRITERLKEFFQTKNDVLILTASGTGSMEAAVVNTFSPGDKVLATSIGEFGERFADIAKVYGANVTKVEAPQGKPMEPQAVRDALRKDSAIKAVLVTHNETSTGVTNDLEAIAKVVKGEFDKLLIVDGISSVGSIPLYTDKWNCDIVLSGSQKGWMTPPGLAFVSISPRGWQAIQQAKMPRYYFDLTKAKKFLETGETPWTPAVSVFFGLDAGLELLAKEGIQNVWARHARVGKVARESVKALGLSLLADEKYASNTVTAVKTPEGVDTNALLKILREEHQVVLAGGQGPLRGKIFRIAHLGLVEEKDMEIVAEAIRKALPKVGFKPPEAASRKPR